MASGFDTPANTTNCAATIKSQGYEFVGRYLSKSTWKTITPQEAKALKAAGLKIVLVYEDGPTSVDYFVAGRGKDDAIRAINQAHALGAPAGTAIYFTVDYDASAAHLDGPIANYFREVCQTVSANTFGYLTGVYGSGASCQAISKIPGVSYTWRAQSTGWAGYKLSGPWNILQGKETTALGLNVDLDETTGASYGAM